MIGGQIVHLEEVTSTLDLALEMAEEGAAEGLVVVADKQTAGRGKEGRTWESPAGGLWLSIILRPSHPAHHAPLFTLLGALASAEAIREISGLEAWVRWPNDLYLREKKVGGILCEMRTAGWRIRHLVMGIGINVNQQAADFSLPLRERATSLRLESGTSWDTERLEEVLYDRLNILYKGLQMGEWEPFWVRLRELARGSDEEWKQLDRMVRRH